MRTERSPSEKSLPHNLDAERALLGSILLDNETLKLIEDSIRPNDFFADSHSLVFATILKIHYRNQPVDVVTLCEELGQAGSLEKAGGIAYLATLSDGIPMGDYSFVQNYARIIKKKAQRRELINTASNLMTRAFQDEDVDPQELSASVMADLAQLAPGSSNGHGKLEAEATKRIARGDCPEIPEAAYCPLARKYYELIEPTTEASRNFHLPSFLTLVGSAIGPYETSIDSNGRPECMKGSVYFVESENVHPIFFTVLVGAAGASKKGTAIAKAARLVQAARPDIHVMRSIDSAEGFTREVMKYQGVGVPFKPVVFRLSEFKSMLAKAARESGSNITSKLCEAYDRDPLEVNTTINAAKVPHPYISFIAATSTKYMAMLNDTDIEGGLGSRSIFVPGGPKERLAEPPDVKQPAYNELVLELGKVIQHWKEFDTTGRGTRFHWSPQAREMWKAFYEDLPAQAGDDPQMQAIIARFDHHCLKTALVYAALDYSHEIHLRHLTPAIRFAEFLIAGSFFIFSEHGVPPWVETERRIIDYVSKRMPKGIQRRALQQHFWKVGSEEFSRRMKSLVGQDSELLEVPRGRQKWVLINQ